MSGGFLTLGGICNAQSLGDTTASTVGTTLTSSGLSPGAWVQLSASIAFDSTFAVFQAMESSNACDYIVDIGVGAAASEVVVASFVITPAMLVGRVALPSYPVPLNIPAGSRVAARVASINFGTFTVSAKIILFDGAFGQDGASIEVINGAAASLTPDAAANTKGSYTQLIASTARDYCAIVPTFSTAGGAGSPSRFMVDIAIGAAASEQIIIPNLVVHATQFNTFGSIIGLIPIEIPAGTRIAARIQEDNTAVNAQQLWLHGVYL